MPEPTTVELPHSAPNAHKPFDRVALIQSYRVPVENLSSQVYSALMDLIHTTDGGWIGMPILSKLVLAMLLSGFFVYAGTRAENTGWSTLWFFTAFACLAYLIANGIAIMR